MNNNIKIILLFCLAGLLTGCGDGSGGRNNAGVSSQSATSTSTAPSQTAKAPTPLSNTSSHAPAPNNTDTTTGRLITIRWNIPTSRENGTALSLNEIARYEIYYFRGDAARDDGTVITVNDPAITNINFTLSVPGTYYFAIASVDAIGAYSDISDPLSIDIP